MSSIRRKLTVPEVTSLLDQNAVNNLVTSATVNSLVTSATVNSKVTSSTVNNKLTEVAVNNLITGLTVNSLVTDTRVNELVSAIRVNELVTSDTVNGKITAYRIRQLLSEKVVTGSVNIADNSEKVVPFQSRVKGAVVAFNDLGNIHTACGVTWAGNDITIRNSSGSAQNIAYMALVE